MIYILFGGVLLLFFISYELTGKDFFSPSTMLTMVFLFSTTLAMYANIHLQYTLHGKTVIIIISCLALSILIQHIEHKLYGRKMIRKRRRESDKLSLSFQGIAIVYVSIVGMLMFYKIGSISNSTAGLSALIANFRLKNATSLNVEYQIPTWLSQLYNLAGAIYYIIIFNLIFCRRRLLKIEKRLGVSYIVIYFLIGLLTGGRSNVIVFSISILVMFHIVTIKEKGAFKKYTINELLKFFIIVAFILIMFYSAKMIVGRDSGLAFWDYIAFYFGNPIFLFDMYLELPPASSNIIGKETFYGLLDGLRKLGLINIEFYQTHLEYRTYNGVRLGNVYTAFRNYHYDFGYIGIFMLHSVFSIFFAKFYESLKRNYTELKAIVFSMVYYAIILYPFSNYLFRRIITLGFIAEVLMVILLYNIFMRKIIKVRY